MARRFARMVATAALVFSTSAGLVVASAGTAQALEWGNAERAAVKVLAEGFQKGGVRAATPGVMRQLGARCAASGPAVAGCAAGVAGIGVGLWALTETSDYWIPWLEVQIRNSETTNDPAGCQTFAPDFDHLQAWRTGPGEYVDFSMTATGTGTNSGGYCYADMNWSASFKRADGTTFTRGPAGAGVTPLQPGQTQSRTIRETGLGQGTRVLQFNAWHVPFAGLAPGGPSVEWKAGDDPNPETGETTSTVNCKRPDGSGYAVNASSVPVDGHVKVAKCDPGDIPVGMTATNGNGTTTLDLTPTDQDIRDYPLCGGAAGCVYRILVDGKACEVGLYACQHWPRVAAESPSRVECHFGPYILPLAECAFLERAYTLTVDPTTGNDSRHVTGPNTDGNPDTYTPPATDPGWNPSTATPTPSPSPTSTPQTTVTASPSPTVTVAPQPQPELCRSRYALGRVQPQTVYGANYLGELFDIATVGGYREDPIPDHPSGLAADFMTYDDWTKGAQLAESAKANAAKLNVDYVIFDQRIWSVSRAAEGWRAMADRGSPTANHKDHVHVTFRGDATAVPCSVDPGDPLPDEGNACWPSGWGIFNPASWVLQPMKCAFIPRKSLSARVAPLQAEFNEKGPAKFFTSAGNLISGIDDDAGGCAGPTMQFKVTVRGTEYGSQAITPFNACAEPMSTVASYTKALSWVVISVGGILAITRAVAMGFGFHFSMGRGGDDK